MHVSALTEMSEGRAREWHRVVAAATDAGPVPTLGETVARLAAPRPSVRRSRWVAGADEIVGTAVLSLFDDPERTHLGEVELHVHPAVQRTGVGSLLLAAMVDAAREDGRRVLMSATYAESSGAGFLAARGFQPALALTILLLKVGEAAPPPEARPGYRLVKWAGVVPDRLAETFAAARGAMNDMPVGDLDYGTSHYDVEKVRALAEAAARRGERLYTVAAVTDEDEIAGFTELTVPASGEGRAQQYDTAVVPAHRGHGLGLWMKAAMVPWLRELHPGVTEIITDCADDNTHMLAVNAALGFRPHQKAVEFQLDL